MSLSIHRRNDTADGKPAAYVKKPCPGGEYTIGVIHDGLYHTSGLGGVSVTPEELEKTALELQHVASWIRTLQREERKSTPPT